MEIPDTLQNRQPAVAGQFYPSDSAELQRTLKKLFSKAPELVADSEVRAIISPHAGYVFSGEVAAAAFKQLDPEKEYKTIFVIGSSHRNSFAGGSVYSIGNYITPLGTVKTDFETAQKLVAENKVLAFDPHYHNAEHSIEVQIPFLQYYLEKDFKIVAILLGTQNKETCRQIAAALKPYFSPENLFVISTDFSHYPAYSDAVKTDKKMADAIATNDPAYFIQALDSCTEKKVANLSTSCCSWPCVLTLMYLTEDKDDIAYKQLMYKNSGDSEYGEKNRVVGYYALSVVQKKQDTMSLTETEKKELLLARNTIQFFLAEKGIPEMDFKSLSPALCIKAGAFVTLKKQGQLRGCIGHFDANEPLCKTVQQMAVAAATRDSRFSAVTAKEMNLIDIEISVLTPLQKIQDVNQIRLGTDGIYIKKGFRSGTFLPQVATDTGWNLEEFLGHCARDKAGIGWDGWKEENAEIFVYQAIVFGENEEE
ncbi:MAG: AmmeMemoRadiSam system protein B [Bacteroidota bacterium]